MVVAGAAGAGAGGVWSPAEAAGFDSHTRSAQARLGEI